MGKYYYGYEEDGGWKRFLVNKKFFDNFKIIWSARLSTGVFGLPSCETGNNGPKNKNEIILGLGDAGLEHIISAGFIPCPDCKPENSTCFSWEQVKDIVSGKYDLSVIEDFADKSKLGFDATRVDYEVILPAIRGVPSRIYLPANMSSDCVQLFAKRILGVLSNVKRPKMPALGFYDYLVNSNFREFVLD